MVNAHFSQSSQSSLSSGNSRKMILEKVKNSDMQMFKFLLGGTSFSDIQ